MAARSTRRFIVAAVLLAVATAASAQSETANRDSLMAIYKVTISQDMCKFEMSDDQAAAIGQASDKLEETLGLTEEDAQKLYDQIEASLARQNATGLCDKNGEWARTYSQTIAQFAK